MARNRDLDAIMKAFSAIPKEARKPIRSAIDKGADELIGRMKYLAPKDKGDLEASIHKSELNDLAVRVQVDDDAALYNEYGTVENQQSPFFWPSVNTLKTKVRRRVDRAIGKAVKDTWKKTRCQVRHC